MALWSLAKEEDVLESLVAGSCLTCGSSGTITREWDSLTTLYETFSCDGCGNEVSRIVQNIHGRIN